MEVSCGDGLIVPVTIGEKAIDRRRTPAPNDKNLLPSIFYPLIYI
jgi:hypothetical protein